MRTGQAWNRQILKQQWLSRDNLSLGLTGHFLQLCQKVTGVSPANATPSYWLTRGSHFLYNVQLNIDLGIDGYDNYQAPMDYDSRPLYRRRLWGKGTINFEHLTKDLSLALELNCTESIKSARTIGDSTYVTISRHFTTNSTPILIELRTLVYTNQPFMSSATQRPVIDFANTVSLPLNLDRNDITKFSFLTFNLHKIHLDREYCRGYEGLPDAIVQGPFMVSLMLYWIDNLVGPVSSFTYRNHEPCLVGEEVVLICRKNEGRVEVINPALNKVYVTGVFTTMKDA